MRLFLTGLLLTLLGCVSFAESTQDEPNEVFWDDEIEKEGFEEATDTLSGQLLEDGTALEVGDEEPMIRRRERDDSDDFFDPLEPIRTLWKSQPVILVDDLLSRRVNFFREIAGESSPVYLVFLFVANSPACNEVVDSLRSVATTYWGELEKRRSVSTSKFYFFLVNATRQNSAKMCKEHRVTKVPTLVLVPQGSALPKSGEEFHEEFIADPSIRDPIEILAWMESLVQGLKLPRPVKVNYLGDTASFLEKYGMLIILFQLVFLFASNIYRFTTKTGWMMLSLGVYFASVSGTIYSFLRGASPFGYSDQHGFMFIYPDRGSQFFLEGLMIGLFALFVSASLLMAGYFIQGKDAIAYLEAWFDGDELIESLPQERRARVEAFQRMYKTAAMCITVSVVFVLNITVIFRRKAPWYNPLKW